jgi:hypothetical protein
MIGAWSKVSFSKAEKKGMVKEVSFSMAGKVRDQKVTFSIVG